MKKTGTNIIIFLFSLIISTNCYSQSYDTALKEYLYGDLEKSIGLFTKLIESKNEIPKSYMYRGAAKSFLGKFPNALSDLDSSFILDPSNKKIYYYYAKLFLFMTEYTKALKYSDSAIQRNPKSAVSYDQRGVIKSLLGDFVGGIMDGNMAISLDSTDQMFYTDRGFAKLKLEKYEEAIKDFDKSLKIELNQKAFADRGLAYSLLNMHKNAIEDYTYSLAINPNDGEVLYYRALSFQATGKTIQACMDFTKSKELSYPLASEAVVKNNCN